jgi:hypothetical protein
VDRAMDAVCSTPCCLEMLSWISSHMMGRCSAACVQSAAAEGRRSPLHSFLPPYFPPSLPPLLSSHGYSFFSEVLQWLLDNLSPPLLCDVFNSDVVEAACSGGQLEVAVWLVEKRKLTVTRKAAVNAATAGSIPILNWIHHTCQVPVSSEEMDVSASNGDVSTLSWLLDNSSLSPHALAMQEAGLKGHLEVIRLLSCQRRHIPRAVGEAALLNGHVDIVQFLQQSTQACGL